MSAHSHDDHHSHDQGIQSDDELGTGLVKRLRPLLGLVESEKKLLWFTVFIGALNQLIIVALGALGAWVVGQAVTGADWSTIKPTAIWIAVLIVPRAILPWLDTIFAHKMAFRVLVVIRDSVVDAFKRLAPGGLLKSRSGDLGSRVIGDVELTEVFFAHTLPQLIVAATVPFASMLLLAWCHPLLPLILIPFAIAVLFVPKTFNKAASAQGNRVRNLVGKLSGELTDNIQGIAEIVGYNAGTSALRRIHGTETQLHTAELEHASRSSHERNLTDAALGFGVLAVMIVAALLSINGQMDRQLFPVAVTVAALSLAPLALVIDVARELNVVAASAQRIANLVEQPAVVAEDETTEALAAPIDLPPRVVFDDVSFRYSEQLKPAVSGLSFTIEPGEMVALVGQSGAGKSTTAHLLMRYWDPASGTITVGGHDLRDIPAKQRRSLISLVPQDIYLFRDTLRENLLLGRPDALDAQIEAALGDAAVAEFVASLPEGLDTMVGERGASMSGGQKQRIAMARAILQDSHLLVLDEPVAHLDAETEATLAEALQQSRDGRSILIIAHRLSTIRLADRVVMIDDGRVVASGPHETLAAESGPYQELVAAQLEELSQ